MIKRLLVLSMLIIALPAFGSPLDENEQRMADWIDAHAEDAIVLLEEQVNISSGTMNHDGVREVGAVLGRELEALGLETEWVELQPEMERAGHLFGRKLTGSGKKFVLIGHLDTVFEASEAFQAFKREGMTAYGPGIEDMKSGDVVIRPASKG